MAKIDQKQVIEYLNQQRQELQQRLGKIETALSALQESPAAPKRKYTRRAAVSESVAAAGRKKAAPARKKPSKQKVGKAPVSATLPPMDDRLVQVLSEIGPSTKAAVIQEMTTRYPHETPQKISRGAALRLSVLAQSGKLQSSKQDDQLMYSVPS